MGTWRKDQLACDVQYIQYFGDQVYRIYCALTTIAVGEPSVHDMFGEFVVLYFVVYPGKKLDARVAIRIGLPDMMNKLVLRRKRKRTTSRILSYTNSATFSSIKYDYEQGYVATFGDSMYEQSIILASFKRGESQFDYVKIIVSIDQLGGANVGKTFAV